VRRRVCPATPDCFLPHQKPAAALRHCLGAGLRLDERRLRDQRYAGLTMNIPQESSFETITAKLSAVKQRLLELETIIAKLEGPQARLTVNISQRPYLYFETIIAKLSAAKQQLLARSQARLTMNIPQRPYFDTIIVKLTAVTQRLLRRPHGPELIEASPTSAFDRACVIGTIVLLVFSALMLIF
jgi:hypothetical protein